MQTVFLRRSRRIYQKVFQRTRSGMERSRSLGRTGSNSRQPLGTLHSGSGFASANTEYAVSLGCTSLHPYLPVVALRAYYTAVKHCITSAPDGAVLRVREPRTTPNRPHAENP